MAQAPTEKELSTESDLPTKDDFKKFALNFDKNILEPLKEKAYYDQDNIFEVLKIQRQELMHSNMLAFLLEPKQSDFLKNFLRVLVETECISDFDFFDILYGNIENVNIDREHYTNDGRPIDILLNFEIIDSNQNKQKVVIVIENKVDSWQHDDQLQAYKKYIDNEPKWEKYRKYYIYLTPNDDDIVEDSAWKRIDYGLIGSALDLTSIKNTDESIKSLFEDYKKTVRSEFMNEEEAKKLAEKIYKDETNFRVLEYIYNHVRPDWVKETSKVLFNLIKAQTGYVPVTEKKRQIVEITENKGVRYLMFKPIAWLKDYPSHYFQVDVSDLTCEFRMNSTQKQPNTKTYYLFDNDKAKTKTKIEELQKHALSNQEQIKTDCRVVINKMFEPNGIIQQWVNSLKSGGNNA